MATLVLRGEVDMDAGRLYASLARTVAQALSVEVTHARFLRMEPDLSLDDEPEPEP